MLRDERQEKKEEEEEAEARDDWIKKAGEGVSGGSVRARSACPWCP